MRALLLAALACAAALAGCAGMPAPAAPGCPALSHGEILLGEFPAHVDPDQPSDILYIAKGLPAGARVDLRVTHASGNRTNGEGTPVAVGHTEFNSSIPDQRLEALRVQPADMAHGVEVDWRVHRNVPAGCDEDGGGGLSHNLGGTPVQGKVLQPGHGAHVWYAGFWENGTLFETNIEAFDHSAWPRAGWYQSIPYDPLPVYVYDQDRSEEPAYWKPLPGAPGTGTPVDGPVGTASATPGLGYYSTIKGFNDGLKGLSTTATRVIRMDAKDAYPAGTTDNPLAGANLVFYVRLADVVDTPCPTPPATGALPCPAPP